MNSGGFDELARRLAEPVSRRGALRIAAGAVVAAAVPGLRPSLAGASRFTPGRLLNTPCDTPGICVKGTTCGLELPDRNGTIMCLKGCCIGASDSQAVCCKTMTPFPSAWCCSKGYRCDLESRRCIGCPPGQFSCGKECCPPGEKCCAPTKLMPKARCYDPQAQCCTPVKGVVPKQPMTKLEWCPNRKAKKNHKPRANGCGPEGGVVSAIIPNRFMGANFKPACDDHDICYETCRQSKTYCDRRFLKLMRKECEDVYGSGLRRQWCKAQAVNYHIAVSQGGGDAYEAAQRDACDCC